MSEPGPGAPLTRREALARERAASVARPAEPVEPAEAPAVVRPAALAPARIARPPARTPQPPRRRPRRGIARRLLGVLVLLFVGALVVAVSMPANAFYQPGTSTAARVAASSHQSLAVDATGENISTTFSSYTASTKAQMLAAQYAGGVGGAFTGPVRWPFPYKVAILSPFGPRGPVAGCPTCAPFHRGVDLAGGNGNPIYSIADGTVTERTGGSWEYGNYVVITSKVGGHTITAIYEHMQDGSCPLVVGQHIAVGEFVGLVGETGEATAPHLHLEIDVDGVLTDPIPWLEANAS